MIAWARWGILPVALPVFLLMGCGSRQASRSDVQSDLRQSASLACETEMFVEYLSQGRSTYYFALGHLQNLRDEVNRSVEELSGVKASPPLMKALDFDAGQLRLLQEQIDDVRRNVGQPGGLDNYMERIRGIRIALQQANSSL